MDKVITGLFLSLMLSGCLVGQHLEMDYTAPYQATTQEENLVTVTAVDDRPYVKNGDKDPWYIGEYGGAAASGIPWNVTTKNKVPLAFKLKEDTEKELIAMGFRLGGSPGSRRLHILIKEWDFESYVDGTFWYELMVTVTAEDGTLLVSSRLKSRREIYGTPGGGAKAGFERKMPRIYTTIIQSIVRKNREVLSALRS